MRRRVIAVSMAAVLVLLLATSFIISRLHYNSETKKVAALAILARLPKGTQMAKVINDLSSAHVHFDGPVRNSTGSQIEADAPKVKFWSRSLTDVVVQSTLVVTFSFDRRGKLCVVKAQTMYMGP